VAGFAEATVGSLLLHEPPVTISLNVVVPPVLQTAVLPEMEPGEAERLTVTVVDATPHEAV
jgi:hypothetical protein